MHIPCERLIPCLHAHPVRALDPLIACRSSSAPLTALPSSGLVSGALRITCRSDSTKRLPSERRVAAEETMRCAISTGPAWHRILAAGRWKHRCASLSLTTAQAFLDFRLQPPSSSPSPSPSVYPTIPAPVYFISCDPIFCTDVIPSSASHVIPSSASDHKFTVLATPLPQLRPRLTADRALLPFALCFSPTTRCPLAVAHYPLPTARSPFPARHCPLAVAHGLLPTRLCPQANARGLLLTHDCFSLTHD